MVTRTRATRTVKESDLPPSIPNGPVNLDDSANFTDIGDAEFAEKLADAAPSLPKSKADTELIITALKQTYTLVGTLVVPFNASDGFIIVKNAEELGESWRMILDNDPKLRKRMKALIQGSGWGTVITAHIAVAIPIMSNHRDSFSHLVKRKDEREQSSS